MALLDAEARHALLTRARAAVAHAIGAGTRSDELPSPESTSLRGLRAGAFVTLHVGGALRGCIGYPEPDLPLVEVVERCAVSAATSDPRFRPLSPAEWDNTRLELSVLGPIEPVSGVQDIVIGRDGLIVESGRRRGLLLPQVAVEWKWDAAEFVAQTCIKAGLPRDAWQKGAKLFRFQAEVFGL